MKYLKSFLLILAACAFTFTACNVVDEVEEEKPSHTITFDANGGTGEMESISVTEEVTVRLPACLFTKQGCDFAGWAVTSDGQKAYADKEEFTMYKKDVTLYAVWTAAGGIKYTVHHLYENAGNTEYMENVSEKRTLTGIAGEMTEATSNIADGFTAQTIEQKEIAEDGSTQIYVYYKRNIITFTFNLNGGTGAEKVQGKYGSTVPSISNPVKENFIFNGFDATIPERFPLEDHTFNALWTKTLMKIELASLPNKTEYFVGDSFDSAGLTVTAVYSDESTETVTGWTTNGSSLISSEGNKTVTVTYKDKTATFGIAVTAVVLDSIKVTSLPSKTDYNYGDEFDSTGMVVQGLYNNGTSAMLTGWTVEGFDSTKTGTITETLKVTYEDKSAEFNLTVTIPLILTSIEVTTLPDKTVYEAGDTFSTDGMVVTGTYNDGSKSTVSGWTTSGFDSETGGVKTITVSYNEKTTSFTVTVKVEYAFHETVTVLPAGTDGSFGTSGKYVYFGDYPQTVLSKDAESEITIDESDTKVMGSITWCHGSDGNWYTKCAENLSYSEALSEYVYNNYSDGTEISYGSTVFRWFKAEPIKWHVVTENYNSSGKALLFAEIGLESGVDYRSYYAEDKTRTVGEDSEILCNNYKYSLQRAFLNGLDYYKRITNTSNETITTYKDKGFLQNAFTESAQELIAVTDVDNSGLSTTDYAQTVTSAVNGVTEYGTVDFTCANTQDKIFLLSLYEITNTDWGFPGYNIVDATNFRKVTDYSMARGGYFYKDGRSAYYPLRSPCYKSALSWYRRAGDTWDAAFVTDTNFFTFVPALCTSLPE